MAEPTPIEGRRAPPPSRVTSQKADAHDPTLNLYQRLLAARQKAGSIPKHGVGPESQGSYPFARDADVKEIAREVLSEVGILVWPTITERHYELLSGQDRGGNPRTTILAVVGGYLNVVNVDKPDESLTIEIGSMGLDTQDKAMSKATTSAIKYGLLNLLLVPTGDDPDESDTDVPVRSGRRAASEGESSDAPPRQRSSQPVQSAQERDPEGECPKHHRAWKAGQYGYYCPAKDDSTERGYCSLKPSKEWAAAHER